MWAVKIKFIVAGIGVLGTLAKKHKVTLTGYPISFSKTQKEFIVFLAGNIFGDERNKIRFFTDLKRSAMFISIEKRNDFIVGILKVRPELQPLYNPFIFHIKPALVFSDGSEIMEVGSFERHRLVKLVQFVEKNLKGQLISIKKEKLKGMSIVTLFPRLTKKQKEAFELALSKGYYDYPRKISVQQLAKSTGLAFSAYHGHLRKAERLLLPYAYKLL